MIVPVRMLRVVPVLIVVILLTGDDVAYSGGFRSRRSSAPPSAHFLVPTTSRSDLAPSPMLGTFYPTPYMTVGGNGVTGGTGYSPLHQYGWSSTSLYGPFSALRAKAAPVVTYSRGYDGTFRPTVGTAFSYPFLPAASPVVYPTRGTVRNGFQTQGTPPWWDTGYNWVDQN